MSKLLLAITSLIIFLTISPLSYSQDNKYFELFIRVSLTDDPKEDIQRKMIIEADKTATTVLKLNKSKYQYVKNEYTINTTNKSDEYSFNFKLLTSYDQLNWNIIRNSSFKTKANQPVNFMINDPNIKNIHTQELTNVQFSIKPLTTSEIMHKFNGKIPEVKECAEAESITALAESKSTTNCCSKYCSEISSWLTCCGAIECCEAIVPQDGCCCRPS